MPKKPQPSAAYAFPVKALNRWAENLLTIQPQDRGEILSVFRYEGSTCSDGGIPLTYLYEIKLSSEADGYRILDTCCRPDESNSGYKKTCSYIQNADRSMAIISNFQPCIGILLSQILEWRPRTEPAGCLCNQANRNHKWKIALQTVHYKILHQE